jgi:hypothetical protein
MIGNRRRVAAITVVTAVTAVAVLLTPGAAAAAPLSTVVHSETVPLGSSTMTVQFTDWPVRAHRSLDLIFVPAGGIEGRSGRLRAVSPDGGSVALGLPGLLQSFGIARPDPEIDLPRYPKATQDWGVDLVTFTEAGTWHLQFTVQGPDGVSKADVPLAVGPRPGPSAVLSWIIGVIPWAAAVPFLVIGWVKGRPTRRRDARGWTW